MANTSGVNLREPEQMNWDNYNPASKYVPPPPCKGVDGKNLVYTAQVPTAIEQEVTDEGLRQYLLDPLTIKGNGVDNYQIRFYRVNVKKFERNGKPIDASSAGNLIRACGIIAKPQKNSEYDATLNATKGKVFQCVLDWTAFNKDTGDDIKGYDNFPDDPERPGFKKSILKAGDTYTVRDRKGNVIDTKTVQAEVLFANARIRYTIDPLRK